MSTDPNPALQLLRLLTAGASTAEIGAVDADPEARDLALRIRSAFDARRRREAELTALVDTARDLAALRDPSVILGGHRPAGARPARHRRRLPHAVRRGGRRHLHARHGRLGVGAVPVGAAQPRRRPRRAWCASTHRPYWTADYFADQRFAHTRGRSHRRRRRGPGGDLRHPAAGRRPSSSACSSPPTGRTRPFSHEEVALLGSLAALAAVSIVQTQALHAETAEALERLSEAHAAVHRAHAAGGSERAAAAHDRFAEQSLERQVGIAAAPQARVTRRFASVTRRKAAGCTGAARSSSVIEPPDRAPHGVSCHCEPHAGGAGTSSTHYLSSSRTGSWPDQHAADRALDDRDRAPIRAGRRW